MFNMTGPLGQIGDGTGAVSAQKMQPQVRGVHRGLWALAFLSAVDAQVLQ